MKVLNPELLNEDCGCGSGESYAKCCHPFHSNEQTPITAEQLMRSRFVAFQLELSDYLLQTWSAETRPDSIEFTPGMKWTKLSINGRKKGRRKDPEGWVTFVAYYQLGSETASLHEKSYFNRNQLGNWQYVDGEIKN